MVSLEEPWWLVALVVLVPWVVVSARRAGLLEGRLGRWMVGLRVAVVLVLVLALAGLSVVDEEDALSVLFVVDRSRSVTATGEGGESGAREAERFVAAALEARAREGDRAGVITFAAGARVEALVRERPEPPVWSAHEDDGGTRLEDALRLALASFPPDTHRRVVVLSDGIETEGRALDQALVARELGVPIDVVPLKTAQRGPDVVAEALHGPPQVEAAQPFDLKLQLRASVPAGGRVLLYRDEALLGALPVQLGGGLEVITLPQTLDRGGLYRYRAVVEATPDGEPRNNEVRATVQVGGAARVLLLEGYTEQAEPLAAALRAAGYQVDVGGVAEVPDTLEGMVRYDAIVLSDIPATELSRIQMTALAHYTRELGRGLVMLGGDQSFGVGGYFRTPVEEVLPVRMTQRSKLELPNQGLVLAIDKSGSMGATTGAGGGAVSKIDIAKEAAAAVVELLSRKDELGVLGFDGSASWVLPYDALDDKPDALRRIGTLRAGGGTDIYNALRASHGAIRRGDAQIKHVVLLSDGIAEHSDLPALVTQMRGDKITLTTVAIGSDSDRYTMESLARLGEGRYYETESPEAIPQIFTRETMLSSRSFLIEGDFVPAQVDPSDVLAGLDALPPLGGYVATTAKPSAQLALQSPQGDPVLAHWRVGLGKALAFTSDAKSRWGSAWVQDKEVYARFWGQALQWVTQTGSSASMAVVASLKGSALTVVADSMSEDDYLSGAQTTAYIVRPDGRREEVTLQQVAPGRYRASVEASVEGTYFVGVQQLLDGREVARAVREVHRAWSPEFAPSYAGTPTLSVLATSTGGRLSPEPGAVWARPDAPITTPRSIAPWLLAALAALWLLDIAHRRFEGFRPPRAPAPLAPEPAAAPATPPRRRAAAPTYTPGLRRRAQADPPASSAVPDAPAPEAQGDPQDAPAPPSRFTSRLLDAKRRSRGGD